jgi:hypothetical protein
MNIMRARGANRGVYAGACRSLSLLVAACLLCSRLKKRGRSAAEKSTYCAVFRAREDSTGRKKAWPFLR